MAYPFAPTPMPTPNWLQPVAPSAAPAAWYDPSSWGGALGGVGDALGRNSGMLLGLGAGLLSGNFGAVPGAIAQGSAADRARNMQDYQLELAAAQREAASQFATNLGHPEWAGPAAAGGLSMGDIFAATRPVAVPNGGYLANQATGLPIFQSGNPQMVGDTGGASPGASAGAPGAASSGAPGGTAGLYRPLSDAERTQFGLKPTDPYAINITTGKPEYVGNPTSVNITNQAEGAYASDRGKALAKNMADIQNAGLQAYGTIGQLNLLQQALSGTYQGAGGQTVQKLTKFAQSLGLQVPANASAGDLANSISNNLALQLRNPAGGAGMPGSLSDADRAFLSSMTANLNNSPQGNALIIEAAKRVQQRNIDVAKLASQYAQQHNGQLDDNFFAALQQYSEANPLFGDMIKAAPAAGQTPPPLASTGGPSAPVDMGNGITIQQIN